MSVCERTPREARINDQWHPAPSKWLVFLEPSSIVSASWVASASIPVGVSAAHPGGFHVRGASEMSSLVNTGFPRADMWLVFQARTRPLDVREGSRDTVVGSPPAVSRCSGLLVVSRLELSSAMCLPAVAFFLPACQASTRFRVDGSFPWLP